MSLSPAFLNDLNHVAGRHGHISPDLLAELEGKLLEVRAHLAREPSPSEPPPPPKELKIPISGEFIADLRLVANGLIRPTLFASASP